MFMTAASRPTDKSKRSAGRTILLIIWMCFKLLLIPAACVAALIVGLAIGYVVLGDQPLSDVFEVETWKHMYDLVFAEGA